MYVNCLIVNYTQTTANQDSVTTIIDSVTHCFGKAIHTYVPPQYVHSCVVLS